jgi:hypothetical protein
MTLSSVPRLRPVLLLRPDMSRSRGAYRFSPHAFGVKRHSAERRCEQQERRAHDPLDGDAGIGAAVFPDPCTETWPEASRVATLLAMNSASYAGPERRRHRVYVTRNSEYHFRDGVCVAVRDRQSGAFTSTHLGIGRPLGGTVRFLRNGVAIPTDGCEPMPGEALFFAHGEREIVTSALCAIERPAKDLVSAYP